MAFVFIRIYRIVRIIVTIGFHIGAFPFYWVHKTKKVRLIKSKWAWARYFTCTAFYFVITSVITLGFIGSIITNKIPVKGMDKTFTIMKFLASFSLALLHLHTYWKRYEIVSFANGSMGFGEAFFNEYGKRRDYKYVDKMGSNILILFCGAWAFQTLIAVPVYLFRCQLHAFYPLLPMCDPAISGYGAWESLVSPLVLIKVLGTMAVQFVVVPFALSSMMSYSCIAVPLTFGAHKIYDALGNTKRGSRLNRHEKWIPLFQGLRLIVIQINDMLSDVLIPAQFTVTITALVLCLLVLIQMETGALIQIGAVMMITCLTVFLVSVIGYAAMLSEKSEIMLHSRRARAGSKYQTAVLKACRPVKVRNGNFGFLERTTFLEVFEIVLEMTIDGLIIDFTSL